MSQFTVLTDGAVRGLLRNLRREEVLQIQSKLSQALVQYSMGSEQKYQPQRNVISRPDGHKTLFMGFTSPTSVGAKIIGVPPANVQVGGPKPVLRGVLVLCDATGKPTGIINAEEVTAFRTSLCAMILYNQRQKTDSIVVFGAGKQALWHIRLALLLRGPEIKKITIINRSLDRSTSLLQKLSEDDQSKWQSEVQFTCVDPSQSDYQDSLKSLLAEADTIFCTTPSKAPLFPAHYLAEKQKTGCYMSAIGSWQSDMAEVHPDILRTTVISDTGYNPKGLPGGSVIVDSREGAFIESGEIVQGEIKPEQVVEVGEITDIQAGSGELNNERLKTWLATGFVIYKSVGLGIMDLAARDALVLLARDHNAGISVANF